VGGPPNVKHLVLMELERVELFVHGAHVPPPGGLVRRAGRKDVDVVEVKGDGVDLGFVALNHHRGRAGHGRSTQREQERGNTVIITTE